jgi:choline dehydrogenase-like flavoprotein
MEIPMGVKSEFGPYFLSPHYSNQLLTLVKEKGFNSDEGDVMGIMIKIADEANGKIYEDGTISKVLTLRDLNLFKEGYNKSIELLLAMGVEPTSISSTPIRGAHPGGTAAIGKVVDKNLETSITGLYIADASVIPQAPGRPPILTITALAKKLSKNLKNQILY